MKKLIIAAIIVSMAMIIFVVTAGGGDSSETGNSTESNLNSYTKDTAEGTTGQNDVGGSGTDTQPSSDGTGPGPEGDLLSQ